MFFLTRDDFAFLGSNLSRPECVLATKSGDIFASHAAGNGGIAHIDSKGRTNFIMATKGDIPADFIPNGFSLMPDGSFLIANVGNDGGVYTLNRDGTLIPFLLENVAGNQKLNQQDGIHPNIEGTKIVANNVWKILTPLLKEHKKRFNY